MLAEARRLLATRGYFETSIEQIAEAAGVAPATVFNYFPNKDALVAQLAGEVFERLCENLDRVLLPGDSTQAHLARALAEAVPAVTEAHALLGPLLLRVLRRAASEDAGGGAASLQNALSRLLVAGQRRGDVRDDAEAWFLAELASATLLAALRHWLRSPRYPLDARMCQVAAVIGDGLRVPSTLETTRRTP